MLSDDSGLSRMRTQDKSNLIRSSSGKHVVKESKRWGVYKSEGLESAFLQAEGKFHRGAELNIADGSCENHPCER